MPPFSERLTIAMIVFSLALPALAATVAAQGTTSYQINPTFSITLLVSPGNLRAAWAAMIANSVADLGIQVQTVSADWGIVNARALNPSPYVLGKAYEQGGFDILITNWICGPEPNPYTLFHSSQFPPAGLNYYLWNNATSDMLLDNITRVMDPALRSQCVRWWQQIAYDELPSIAIFYEDGIVPFRSNLNSTPFATNYYPKWPGVEQWNFISSPQTSVTVAQAGYCPYGGLSPYHSNYYSDITGYAPVYGELGSGGLLIRSQNSTKMDPYMAYGNYTMSPDGRNWTFWIRPGIRFQNGEELDARDVVYTYRYIMTPSWQSTWLSYVTGILGSERNVYWAGESGTPGAGEAYNRYEVHFDLPQPWAFFEQDIGGGAILPSSILVNSSSGIPDFSAWHPDAVNTPRFVLTSFVTGDSTSYSYYAKNGTKCVASGPIGAGPYRWVSYNQTTETAHLSKFNGYFNRAALESRGAYGITDYYVKHVADVYSAISLLNNDTVQVLDSHYHFGPYLPTLNPASSNYVSYPGNEIAEMGFNMRHPIFGTGVNTPLGQADPTRAAEAARHVRYAFEYLVPKEAIIATFLNGYGVPGLTTGITRNMPGFNYAISLRNASAQNAEAMAMNELELAGYTFSQPPHGGLIQLLSAPILITIMGFSLVLVAFGVIRRRGRSDRVPAQVETIGAGVHGSAAAVSNVVICPNCRSAVRSSDAYYCPYCGTHLVTGSLGKGIPDRERSTLTPAGRCMVCELQIAESDPIVRCPYCGNVAHRAHMLEWLHVKDYCPVCHNHVDEENLLGR